MFDPKNKLFPYLFIHQSSGSGSNPNYDNPIVTLEIIAKKRDKHYFNSGIDLKFNPFNVVNPIINRPHVWGLFLALRYWRHFFNDPLSWLVNGMLYDIGWIPHYCVYICSFCLLLSLSTTTIIMIGIIVLFTPKMVAVYWHWVAHIGNDTDSKKNSNHIMGLI